MILPPDLTEPGPPPRRHERGSLGAWRSGRAWQEKARRWPGRGAKGHPGHLARRPQRQHLFIAAAGRQTVLGAPET